MTYKAILQGAQEGDTVEARGETAALALAEACALVGMDVRVFTRALPETQEVLTANGGLRAMLVTVN